MATGLGAVDALVHLAAEASSSGLLLSVLGEHSVACYYVLLLSTSHVQHCIAWALS